MANRGRPSDYRPEYVQIAATLCAKFAATDEMLAAAFNTSIPTLHRWRAQNEDFRKAVTLNKQDADDQVERALFQRAVGYTTTETLAHVIQGKVVLTEIPKHYPPDPMCAIRWLSNRRPQQWREVNNPPNGAEQDAAAAIQNARKRAKREPVGSE